MQIFNYVFAVLIATQSCSAFSLCEIKKQFIETERFNKKSSKNILILVEGPECERKTETMSLLRVEEEKRASVRVFSYQNNFINTPCGLTFPTTKINKAEEIKTMLDEKDFDAFALFIPNNCSDETLIPTLDTIKLFYDKQIIVAIKKVKNKKLQKLAYVHLILKKKCINCLGPEGIKKITLERIHCPTPQFLRRGKKSKKKKSKKYAPKKNSL